MDFPEQTARFFCLFLGGVAEPRPAPFFQREKGGFFPAAKLGSGSHQD